MTAAIFDSNRSPAAHHVLASSRTLVFLQASVAIFMTWFNFCRVHQTLRVTPAMEAGLTKRVWSIRDLLTTETAVESTA